MRVLFTSISVPSHLLPMVPLAGALRAAGHEVLLAGAPDLVPHAEAAGLVTARVGTEAFEADRRRRMAQVARQQAAAPGGTWRPTWEQLAARWRERVDAVIDDLIALGRWWRPDLIVADPLEFGARVLGGVLDVPVVVHRFGPETLSTESAAHVREALAGVCARVDAPSGLPEPALVLDPCPPGLQFPSASPALPVRHVPFNGSGSVPAWAREGSGGRRRVCVSLGSVPGDLGGEGLLRSLVAALSDRDGVELLVPLDAKLRGTIDAPPDFVRVVEPAPLGLFLDTCAAVVHHGGSGTALTAIGHGLPQLVLPQFNPALSMCAERVAAVGAGVQVPAAEQGDAGAIAEGLRTVLQDPRPCERAEALRAAMASQPTPADLVPRLESLALTGARAA
ncbi:nucleotide disphospho-sugar-binding domain-containing protein [Streptomyces sp. NPDC048606]|uniref:nucleotide disphospho-sugar-binding domain-containing protein n=1 Tax=Streptomyces sp. NPDC048606 TaxID=3154726 RepID=UPI003439B0B5